MNLLKKSKNDLLSQSSRAICGLQEREIVVHSDEVEETKRKLRARGFFIVGTSEVGGKSRKIWFTPAVSL